MNERHARIRDKLERIRQAWFRRRSFGEESHRFELRQPLAEAMLGRFEAEHGIALPPEYREFLAELGNGGAGPGYGLLPLDHWADATDDEPLTGFLARPCPLRLDISGRGDWLSAIGCDRDDRYHERYQGTLALCHQGCAHYGLLVVSGPACGRIVNVSLDDHPPVFTPDVDFLAWYERWLDEVLKPRHLGEVAWFGHETP